MRSETSSVTDLRFRMGLTSPQYESDKGRFGFEQRILPRTIVTNNVTQELITERESIVVRHPN